MGEVEFRGYTIWPPDGPIAVVCYLLVLLVLLLALRRWLERPARPVVSDGVLKTSLLQAFMIVDRGRRASEKAAAAGDDREAHRLLEQAALDVHAYLGGMRSRL